MPTADDDLYREAIRKTLMHRAGDLHNASAVAEATFSIWHQMASRLLPVIGARGLDILLSRSLYLTSKVFPWLAIAGDQGGRTTIIASVKTRLAGSPANTAEEASYTLIITFVELLTNLIGKSLTDRLLGPVWAPPLPASEKENQS